MGQEGQRQAQEEQCRMTSGWTNRVATVSFLWRVEWRWLWMLCAQQVPNAARFASITPQVSDSGLSESHSLIVALILKPWRQQEQNLQADTSVAAKRASKKLLVEDDKRSFQCQAGFESLSNHYRPPRGLPPKVK
jgi:hypothetical protein